MEVRFNPDPDQEAFIREGIASGRDAMAHWEQSERTRIELLSALDAAEEDLEAGRYDDYTDETLSHLARELKIEARRQPGPR